MKVLEAKIKSFRYNNQEKDALRDIDIEVSQGEVIVLTGLSGCGKTTLTRILNGLIPHHYSGRLVGNVRILGKRIEDYAKGELAKYIGNVFQNPSDQFFAEVAEDEVVFVGENLGMPLEELKKKTKEAFEKMDIVDLMDKKLFHLSGGQKQKVAIASTLIYDTKIIFLDEPSSNLDYSGIIQLREIIRALKKMGKTIIITEHRLFFLNDIYDRLIYMKDGGIARVFEAGGLTEEDCKNYGLRRINYKDLKAENTHKTGEVLETVDNLGLRVGDKDLIKNLSFSLKKGEIMGVIGENGIGKTSLGEGLVGLRKIKGEVSFGTRPKTRLKKAYYMMQDVDYQIFFDTVENELVPKAKKREEEYLDRLRKILDHIDLLDKTMNHPQELSGGEKQRLALVTAFLSNRRLIILDEPTSGLDYVRMEKMAELIERYSENRPVVLISHDLELIFKVCNTVLMLSEDSYKKVDVINHEEEIVDFFLGMPS